MQHLYWDVCENVTKMKNLILNASITKMGDGVFFLRVVQSPSWERRQ